MSALATEFHYPGAEFASLAHAKNYYRWILSYFEPVLGQSVLELGAGAGNFSEHLLKTGRVERLLCVEPAGNLVQILRRRFSRNPNVDIIAGYLEDVRFRIGPVDSVVCVNVLEHVEDDDDLLGVVYESLVPGGTLLLFVPAVPCIYGSLDTTFGHRRRYTREALRVKLHRVGFDVRDLRYFNLPGILTWAIAGKVMRRTTIGSPDVLLFDRFIVPWWRHIEDRIAPPIGQSLLSIAFRPERADS